LQFLHSTFLATLAIVVSKRPTSILFSEGIVIVAVNSSPSSIFLLQLAQVNSLVINVFLILSNNSPSPFYHFELTENYIFKEIVAWKMLYWDKNGKTNHNRLTVTSNE